MSLRLRGLVILSSCLLLRYPYLSCFALIKEQTNTRHAGEIQALIVAHVRDKVRARLKYEIEAFGVCMR
jgi:hypothetical protein